MWEKYDPTNPDHQDPSKYEFTPGSVKDHVIEVLRCADDEPANVKLAAMFHDVGKPISYKEESDGRTTYKCHDFEGVKAFEKIAERMKISNAEKDEISFVIQNHMKMHLFMEMSKAKCFKLVNDKHWETLYKVSVADDASRGAFFEERNWVDINNKVEEMKQVVANSAEIAKVVNGNIVMTVCGAKGKRIGEIIQKVKDYIINKGIDVTTSEGKEKAMNYMKAFKVE